MNKAFQSYYIIENVDKNMNGNGKIYCKSGIEYKTAWYLDHNNEVVKWGYELFSIPYLSPVDGKIHQYWPDFYMEMNRNNVIKKFLIEVKCTKEINSPVKPKKNAKKSMTRFMTESQTYIINQTKWTAAKMFCDKNDMEFKTINEQDLK